MRRLWWELVVTEEDGSTRTVDHLDELQDALKALDKCRYNIAFIDLWEGSDQYGAMPSELGVSINKEQLRGLYGN